MSNSYELFEEKNQSDSEELYIPLAERYRPKTINEIIGHEKILNSESVFVNQIKNNILQSTIFWGPPGVGKTTLARAISNDLNLRYYEISAVTSGKKELAQITSNAFQNFKNSGKNTLLFIDEIHRFNKVQQDGLLHSVERGIITLIGATTENPSFEVIAPLLSRCQIIKLEPLTQTHLKEIILRVIKKHDVLSKLNVEIPGIETLISMGGGDARKTINLLESCLNLVKAENKKLVISEDIIKKAAESNILYYDKRGNYHYDTISAFIKSVRGSDPDAAVYYLARMIDAGEDPIFIIRRLIVLASEDVGNAEPYALSLATAAMHAVQNVGMPEARIILAQVTTYLASCPKSNASYLAINAALKDVKKHPDTSIPIHLRNAVTDLMKKEKYGENYKYPHNFKNHFVSENYLPINLKDKRYYFPSEMGREKKLKEWLRYIWKSRFK